MRLLVPVLVATLTLQAQVPRAADIQERRLASGARLLLVERRGLSAFHATLVFRGGRAEESAALAGATDLLARTLFAHTWPEDLEPAKGQGLDSLLKQEEGRLEAIRLERLRLRRDASATSQLGPLEAGLQAIQARLGELRAPSPLSDVYVARGGRQTAEATADGLIASTELPREAFEFWCRTETQRLHALQLSRFSEARADFTTELRNQGPQGMALLRGAALPGHPYGRDLSDYLPAMEALRWSDLRAHAQRTLSPDRLTIILVGPISMESALPLLERTLGALPPHAGGEEAVMPEIPGDLGDRRVQAALGGEPRLLTGWRIPSRNHADHLALRMAAQLLVGGHATRLPVRLVRQKALVREVDLDLDLPGGRLPGLLVIDLKPADGHSLAEIEGALHGEILRLQQEPISAEEWQRALAQLEADHIRVLDEPALLAHSLSQAFVEIGDWRMAGLDIQRLRALTPEAVQLAVRAWLNPTHRTTVLLEPHPSSGLDPLDAELTRVLTAIAAGRIEDPARREQLVSEGLRQLRMLRPEERQRTLKLLGAQLDPDKR